MAFKNVKIIDPYVEKGWSPKVELTLSTPDEVNALEDKLNVSFPEGYKEYVTTLGRGEYCYNAVIRVDMPSTILSEYKEYRQRLAEDWFWEEGEDVLPLEKAVECVRIASTDGGDEIIFHPANPGELFLLPHDEEIIYKIGGDLYEAIDWVCVEWDFVVGGKVRKDHGRRYFVPYNRFAYTHGVLRPEGF